MIRALAFSLCLCIGVPGEKHDEQNVPSCFSKTEYLHTQTEVPVF